MATSFSGGIVASDGFKISIKNTPMDIRTRIESLDEILSIPNPFIGMIFYVSGEDQFYVVKTLKPKSVGAMIITDALIDQYEPLHKDLDRRKHCTLTGQGASKHVQGEQGRRARKDH